MNETKCDIIRIKRERERERERERGNILLNINVNTWQASFPSRDPPAQNDEAGKMKTFSVTAFIFAVQS